MPDLHVGKYAAYIWPAYGITALVFAILIGGALSHARRWRRRAEAASLAMSDRPRKDIRA